MPKESCSMQVAFRIRRFDPDRKPTPAWQVFIVEDVSVTDTVLDVLHRIKWEQDGTLSFRRSCAHGICGSCGMRINNQSMLSCSTLLQDLKHKKPISIEPLAGQPVIKDLVVDMTSFYEKLAAVKPYLVNESPPPSTEREQNPEDAERLFEAAKCILCGCCTTSCPSTWTNSDSLGPSALLKAYRFVFDTRDHAADERLSIVDSPNGIWRCHTVFNCNEACPKEIDITGHLSELKRAVVASNI
jgi:succinate dehydrogenase / fumarate reductase, iron-sulfur subunit